MGHFVYQHAGQVYVCYHLLLGGGAVSEFTSTVYPAQIHIFSQCGHHNHFHDEQLRQAPHQTPSQHISNHSSCKPIVNVNPSAPSGYYNITTTNGSAVQVYCDMERRERLDQGDFMLTDPTWCYMPSRNATSALQLITLLWFVPTCFRLCVCRAQYYHQLPTCVWRSGWIPVLHVHVCC